MKTLDKHQKPVLKQQQALQRLTEKIAEHLPDWSVVPAERRDDYPYLKPVGTMVQGDLNGPAIILRWLQNQRFQVGGRMPVGASAIYGIEFPATITLSGLRPPKQLASEILRRFVPDYLARRNVAEERIAEATRHEQGKTTLAEEIAGLVGHHGPINGAGDDPRVSLYRAIGDCYGDVRVTSPDTADFELRSLSRETALELARWIGERRKQ